MLGQDVAILLKLAITSHPNIPVKQVAEDLCLPQSEVSKSLQRCQHAGLLYRSDMEKRVNKTALLEFLGHGLRYVFPPQVEGLTRGLPTAVAAEPLKSEFLQSAEPPYVWAYSEGTARGLSLDPLYKNAPQAALRDDRLYRLLALCDALRIGRVREKNRAIEHLQKELNRDGRSQSLAT